MSAMTFKWRDDPPLSFPSDFGKDGYRLPKYVVSFFPELEPHIVYYGEGRKSNTFSVGYIMYLLGDIRFRRDKCSYAEAETPLVLMILVERHS